ncbi:hypothetical protein SAY86_015322 [Trapa natans]|uniref:Uncharacterized protein n=1 Tax=Trapa natans TaxID=22666 RepID=A0AAN7KR15_TRANT|nr:hypothetical protein SAY86_015322 [Trapa natans]
MRHDWGDLGSGDHVTADPCTGDLPDLQRIERPASCPASSVLWASSAIVAASMATLPEIRPDSMLVSLFRCVLRLLLCICIDVPSLYSPGTVRTNYAHHHHRLNKAIQSGISYHEFKVAPWIK